MDLQRDLYNQLNINLKISNNQPLEETGISLHEFATTESIKKILFKYAERQIENTIPSPLILQAIAEDFGKIFETYIKKANKKYYYSLKGFSDLPNIFLFILKKKYGLKYFQNPDNIYYNNIINYISDIDDMDSIDYIDTPKTAISQEIAVTHFIKKGKK